MDRIFFKLYANRIEAERLILEAMKSGLKDLGQIENYLNSAISNNSNNSSQSDAPQK